MIADAETLTTADLVAAAAQTQKVPQKVQQKVQQEAGPGLAVPTDGAAGATAAVNSEPLAPLFQPQEAQDFRATWDRVQIGFVDDPQQAVRKADELVAQVMKTLAESFSNERSRIESAVDGTDQASTEGLRVALRRYRSFFLRLLSL